MLSLNLARSYNKNKKLAILRSGLGIHIRLGSQQIPVIKDKNKSDLKLYNAPITQVRYPHESGLAADVPFDKRGLPFFDVLCHKAR